jgi:four helix bundle protein
VTPVTEGDDDNTKILDLMVEMVERVHRAARYVARHDRDLAGQMKRSSSSVALNGSEGLWARGGKRTTRLEDAINSARETIMALRLARACGYLPAAEAQATLQHVDGVIAVLWTLTYRR